MGITAFEIQLLEKVLQKKPDIRTVIELGSQNLYNGVSTDKPPFASEWYRPKGIHYSCIDLAGDNNALKYDLSKPLLGLSQYDLVTDFGTSEHVVRMDDYTKESFHGGHINSIYPKKVTDSTRGLFSCWNNKHNLLGRGGIMINVNPKTGHWPGHGYHYYTQDFYRQLCKQADYILMEVGETAAMGNSETGMNIYSIMVKTGTKFINWKEFNKLDFRTS